MTATSGVITGEVAQGQAPAPRTPRRGLDHGAGRRAFYLIAPTVVLLAIVIIYPVVKAVVMSFSKDSGLDKATGLFVAGGFAGVGNFAHWLTQSCAGGSAFSCPTGTLGSQFWSATGFTFFVTVVAVVLETVLGMLFALVMNRSFKGRAVLRASVLVPWAIPTAVTAKLWYFIFAYDGIANKILGTHVLWTGNGFAPKAAIIIADTWKTAPFMALLILAGLQIIDSSVYEAARVDGASAWQSFWFITLPLVRPALMVAVLFRTLDTLRMFDLPYILTGGAGGTTTLSMLVVDQIRQGFNAAAALSTITFVIVFLVALVFIRFLGANVAQQRVPAAQKG